LANVQNKYFSQNYKNGSLNYFQMIDPTIVSVLGTLEIVLGYIGQGKTTFITK
jgi:hypothetical protein